LWRPTRKGPANWRGKCCIRWGPSMDVTRPVVCRLLVGACALFPDFNPLRNAPATADKSDVLVSV
jgi:hypothetical protein